jgi:hypothetical protein
MAHIPAIFRVHDRHEHEPNLSRTARVSSWVVLITAVVAGTACMVLAVVLYMYMAAR